MATPRPSPSEAMLRYRTARIRHINICHCYSLFEPEDVLQEVPRDGNVDSGTKINYRQHAGRYADFRFCRGVQVARFKDAIEKLRIAFAIACTMNMGWLRPLPST